MCISNSHAEDFQVYDVGSSLKPKRRFMDSRRPRVCFGLLCGTFPEGWMDREQARASAILSLGEKSLVGIMVTHVDDLLCV